MKAEAEANADTDRKTRERAEKLNQADSMIFQTEKQLREFGDKVPANLRENIEKAVADLRDAHKAEDIERIDTASEALNTAWAAASQEIYQATQAANGGSTDGQADGGGAQAGNGAGSTQDVEFEEVKS